MIDRFIGDYAFLSNFYPANVRWGFDCKTVEHAYQGAKAKNDDIRALICNASTSYGAKHMGKRIEIRPDWERVKLRIMEYLLRQKFAPNSDLATKLLATGNEELVEGNTWGDRFWGVCGGRGENNLGKLLMKIRDELRNL